MSIAQKRLSTIAMAIILAFALALGGAATGLSTEQAFADGPAATQMAAKNLYH